MYDLSYCTFVDAVNGTNGVHPRMFDQNYSTSIVEQQAARRRSCDFRAPLPGKAGFNWTTE